MQSINIQDLIKEIETQSATIEDKLSKFPTPNLRDSRDTQQITELEAKKAAYNKKVEELQALQKAGIQKISGSNNEEQMKNVENTYKTLQKNIEAKDDLKGTGIFNSAAEKSEPKNTTGAGDIPIDESRKPKKKKKKKVRRTLTTPKKPSFGGLKKKTALLKNKSLAVIKWSAANAPAMMTGAAVGYGVRSTGMGIAAKFVLAAGITSPVGLTIATTAATVAVGALAGGVASVVTAKLFGKEENKNKAYYLKRFRTGATLGGIFSVIGFVAADNAVAGTEAPTAETPRAEVPTEAQTPQQEPTTEPKANATSQAETKTADVQDKQPTDNTKQQQIVNDLIEKGNMQSYDTEAAFEESKQAVSVDNGQPEAGGEADVKTGSEGTAQEVNVAGETVVKGLLTEKEFAALGDYAKSIASSTNPAEQARFCAEVANSLMNPEGSMIPDDAVQKKALAVLNKGLEIAEANNFNGTTTKELFANAAYLNSLQGNMEVALEQAGKSGDAVNNFGERFAQMFGDKQPVTTETNPLSSPDVPVKTPPKIGPVTFDKA